MKTGAVAGSRSNRWAVDDLGAEFRALAGSSGESNKEGDIYR